MGDYNKIFLEEASHLQKIITVAKRELEIEMSSMSKLRKDLISTRKEMWEDTSHYTDDFEKLTEVVQHLSEVTNQSAVYGSSYKRVEKYRRMIDSPYFGRFDFVEEGSDECESIYVGLGNLSDSDTNDIYVYDWRSPISSIFYRFEPGNASYSAPYGEITGQVLLKRQYKIQHSKLKYFFDCSIRINDEILQEVLSQNSSVKMRSIVETIQKEQDIIIRDTENELLIVQGAAGSGKTSIALHRVAFLLYQGIGEKLTSNNIMIISPNSMFSKYISNVLPELGEENVEQITTDELFSKCIVEVIKPETRHMQLESMVQSTDETEREFKRQCIEFKGSNMFKTILDRMLWYFEHKLIKFEDIYYSGRIIENRQLLKSEFLNNKTDIPMTKRLNRIESRIMDKIHPLQKERAKRYESIVKNSEGHDFEVKSLSRLLSIKETSKLIRKIHSFTVIDPFTIYKMLFSDRKLFLKLSYGLKLPECIEQVILRTLANIDNGYYSYEDMSSLTYLKLKMDGANLFPQIRQVIIDEAQDYYPIHYNIFKLLFKDSKFTVLGDIHQSIEKDVHLSLYDDVIKIMGRKRSVKLTLNKSYRSSYEINTFAQMLLNRKQDFESFERHEEAPKLKHEDTREGLDKVLSNDIADCLKRGFETIAVLCKSHRCAEKLYNSLKNLSNVRLLDTEKDEAGKGIMVMPVYMSKGLEFDAVFIYDADKDTYSSEFDRKLLYIACTRALHILRLYYTGEKTPLIPDSAAE